MPFVVTTNCIVCKDLTGDRLPPAPSADATASERAGQPRPRWPEHVQRASSQPVNPADAEQGGKPRPG